jgi:hypothetical protein
LQVIGKLANPLLRRLKDLVKEMVLVAKTLSRGFPKIGDTVAQTADGLAKAKFAGSGTV